MMLDLGRSTDSCRTDSRDLLEVVLEKKEDEPARAVEVTGPRLTSLLARNNLDLSRSVKVPPPSAPSFCRRSPNLSRLSLASDPPDSDLLKAPSLDTFTHSLTLISLSSLLLAGLAFYVMNTFINMQEPPPSTESVGCRRSSSDFGSKEASTKVSEAATTSNSSSEVVGNDSLLKAGFALSSMVLSSCLCCLMVCTMQCYFTAKILKTSEGEERAHKYLRECSSSRILALTGFFLSIPVFLATLLMLMVLRVGPSQAVVACVFPGIALLFCVLSFMQNCYHWRVEKARADGGLPVYDSRFSFPRSRSSPRKQSELCTLV